MERRKREWWYEYSRKFKKSEVQRILQDHFYEGSSVK